VRKERLNEKDVKKVIENIFKAVPEGMLVFTNKLNLLVENKAFRKIIKEYSVKLNYTKQKLREIIIKQVKDKIVNEDYPGEIRIPRKLNKNEEFILEFNTERIHFEKDLLIVASLKDITKHKHLEEEIRKKEERFKNIVERNADGIFVVDKKGMVRFVNSPAKSIFGKKVEKLIGEYFGYPVVAGEMVEIDIIRKDGKPGVGEMRIVETEWEGSPAYLVSIRDITEQKKAEEKIKYMSFHDALTDLYNRAFFEEELKRLNNPRNYPLTVIMADINGLKLVNDTLGHNKGDELLKDLAKVLKSVVRKGEIIARIGGDEFAIILPHCDENVAEAFLNRFRVACKKHNNKSQLKISIALGYATQSGQYRDIKEILKEADENMYSEKLSDTSSKEKYIIETIKTVLAIRDPHTEDHAERLQNLAEALGRDIKLPESGLNKLRLLSLLHDIGKIGTPDNILFKPGKLTEKEWEIMKKHTEDGYKMAKNIPQLLPIAKEILHHHERWDGKGYPEGLKAKEIPILSRIISIIDAYDAMINDRPYRKAMSKEKAIQELKNNIGTQFDPELVERFLKILKDTKKEGYKEESKSVRVRTEVINRDKRKRSNNP